MVKVSVIVPVFEPGERMDPLIESLLGQSMAPADHEIVFVDAGSADGTGSRLAALAAEHDHVTTLSVPNSGSPGRPRNVGIDSARGEFLYFVDQDDWIGREALERLHAVAVADEADIVIGKVVGHGRAVPRSLFRENVHDLPLRAAPFNLLTPHKLFRKATLDEHGTRFPEQQPRVEAALMVVSACLHARRMVILADYPCYHWVNWGSGADASDAAPDSAAHFATERALLDLIDGHTEPGELRDALYGRVYRGMVLGRLGRSAFARAPETQRRSVVVEATRLIGERFPPRLDAPLNLSLKLRAALARRGDHDALVALADFERNVKAGARVRDYRGDGTWMTLHLECWLRSDQHEPFSVVRRDGRIHWLAPEPLRGALDIGELDVTDELAQCRLQLVVKRRGEEVDWLVPADIRLELPESAEGEPVRALILGTSRIAPTIAAAGSPLTPGDHAIRASVTIAGFSAHAFTRRGGGTFGLTVTPAGRVYREGHVPEPPPPPTARQRAGRLVRRIQGRRGARAER